MPVHDLRDALVHELKDLYSAETQLTKTLPKMAEKASDEALKGAFEHHLKETEGQVERLKEALHRLEATTGRQKCQAMSGLIEEGEKTAKEAENGAVCDALLIAAAQKVEHYEIASYGTVIAWCNTLGLDEIAELLSETMEQEKTADQKLTDLAAKINQRPQPAPAAS
jgi:ferritin-like metal-binding protein YciE